MGSESGCIMRVSEAYGERGDWRRLPGSAENYVNTVTGDTTTRRGFDKAFRQRIVEKSTFKYVQFKTIPALLNWLKSNHTKQRIIELWISAHGVTVTGYGIPNVETWKTIILFSARRFRQYILGIPNVETWKTIIPYTFYDEFEPDEAINKADKLFDSIDKALLVWKK